MAYTGRTIPFENHLQIETQCEQSKTRALGGENRLQRQAPRGSRNKYVPRVSATKLPGSVAGRLDIMRRHELPHALAITQSFPKSQKRSYT